MPFDFTWDGHVHSGFCPHGSGEPTRYSIEKAIERGFRRISIIEHYPLPPGFPRPPTVCPVDLSPGEVGPYLEETLALREEFADRIEVLAGFEWDYLPGWEDWMRGELEKVGPMVQDGIMSVHFMDTSIIDENAEIFIAYVENSEIKTLDRAYRKYYETVLSGVKADLGPYKPRRIGHLNLIRRFQTRFQAPGVFRDEILEIAKEAASRGMQLDLNMSGLRRPLCGEPYVPVWLMEMIARGEIDIMCVFGSDAHSSDSVGLGLDEAVNIVNDASAVKKSI